MTQQTQMGHVVSDDRPISFRCRDHRLHVQEKTWIVGVLNITPDSFSDGGRFLEPGAAG